MDGTRNWAGEPSGDDRAYLDERGRVLEALERAEADPPDREAPPTVERPAVVRDVTLANIELPPDVKLKWYPSAGWGASPRTYGT